MGRPPTHTAGRRAATRLLGAVTSAALLLGVAAVAPATAAPSDATIDVYTTFEGFTLGQGYYIEPVKMTVPAGTTAAQVTADLLEDRNHAVSPDPGDPTSPSWYLHGVAGMDKGTVQIPSWLSSQDGFVQGPEDGDGYLATPDYNAMSGWMYTVDNVMAPVGAGAYELEDGDVMRWQFTVYGYGCDLGVASGCWGSDPYFEMVDRSALIREIADPDPTTATEEEIAAGKAVAINPTATATQVAAAVQALTTVEPWTVVTTTATGQFLTQLQAALVAQHGQTAGSYDYSAARRVKVVGPMAAADWTALRNTALAGTHVRDLDLSGMTSSSMQALNGMTALTSVVLPKVTTLTVANLFQGATKLRDVTVQASTTSFGGTTTFNGATSLARIEFLGASAPKTFNASTFNGSNNADPDRRVVVAVVPDRTSGGYQKAAFAQFFADVVDAGPNPAATAEERDALRKAVADARAATRISIVTEERWDALQSALTHGTQVLDAAGSTVGAVNDATADLTAALAVLHGQTFQVTQGAQVGLYQKGTMHFTPFTAFELTTVPELSTATHDVYAPKTTLANGTYNVQASIPGKTDKVVRVFTVSATTVPSRLDLELTPNAERAETSLQIPGLGAGDPRNLYTNVGDTGVLELAVGEKFSLDTFRTSQAQTDQVSNYFIEPDFTFDVAGDSITTAAIGSEGRRQLEITATSPGTSVVKVTYGALKYTNAAGTTVDFNPIEEQNTGLVVVRVGEPQQTFATGIEVRNELDTFYFDRTRGSRPYTFTPAAGTSVRVHDPLNVSDWGQGWKTYEAAEDGSFTVTLKGGRNVVELTRDGVVEHRVLRAKGIDVTVENVTDPGADFEVGDQAKVSMTGVEGGIEKMAGIYNPAFAAGTKPKLTYRAGDITLTSNEGGQYTSATTTYAVTYTYTGDETQLEGTLSIGGLGAEWPYHRQIPLTGKPANLNAVAIGPYTIGAMPTIHVYDGKVTTAAKKAPVDTAALAAAVATAKELDEQDWTATTWAALAAPLTAAQAVLADEDAVQADVDTALAALDEAVDALVRRTAPATPAAPTTTVLGTDVTVEWTAPADGGSALTGYTVTLSGGEKPLVVEVAPDATSTTFEALAAGTYRASVRAHNALGASAESGASEPVTVTVPTPEPQPATPVGTRVEVTTGTLTYGKAGTVGVVVTPVSGTAKATGTVRATFGAVTVTGRLSSGKATLKVPATAWEPGRRAFTVAYVPGDKAFSASRTQSVVSVAKARAAVKVSATKKVRRGKVVTVKVAVSAPGTKATGKVRVTLGGKKVTARVDARGKAVVKIRLSKKAKLGKRAVAVRYLGSSRVGSATAKSTHVRVVR